MTHDPFPASPASGHHPRSEAVWSAARADYLAGGSAAEVCERHGLSLSTFRWRARNEGWRRADQPETPVEAPFVDLEPDDDDWSPPPYDPFGLEATGEHELDRVDTLAPFPSDDDDPPAVDIYETPQELAEMAWAHAARAVRRGRMIEARGWTRLYRELASTRRLTAEEAGRWKQSSDESLRLVREAMDKVRASVAARAGAD